MKLDNLTNNMTDRELKTAKAMDNLQSGYRFSERYSCWVHILLVKKDLVIYMQQDHKKQSGWKLVISNKDEFKNRFSYNSPHLANKYWVTFIDLHEETKQNSKAWILEFIEDPEQKIEYSTKILLKSLLKSI